MSYFPNPTWAELDRIYPTKAGTVMFVPTDAANLNARGVASDHRQHSTIEEAGRHFAASLLNDLRAGEVNEEYGYGSTRSRVEMTVLAGGGPGAQLYVVLDEEGDVDVAFVEYIEASGGTCVRIDPFFAEQLRTALRTPVTS